MTESVKINVVEKKFKINEEVIKGLAESISQELEQLDKLQEEAENICDELDLAFDQVASNQESERVVLGEDEFILHEMGSMIEDVWIAQEEARKNIVKAKSIAEEAIKKLE